MEFQTDEPGREDYLAGECVEVIDGKRFSWHPIDHHRPKNAQSDEFQAAMEARTKSLERRRRRKGRTIIT